MPLPSGWTPRSQEVRYQRRMAAAEYFKERMRQYAELSGRESPSLLASQAAERFMMLSNYPKKREFREMMELLSEAEQEEIHRIFDGQA